MKMNKQIRRRQIRRKRIGICKFLYEKLEDNKFNLAQWTNKKKGEFSLHWLHASSGSWEMKTDSELFRLWALHKGKLGEGEDQPKYKTWKANFRCAMKSRFELEEIKVEHSKSGKKDVKFWKFRDLSFINEQSQKTQIQNTDDRDFDKRSSQIEEITKNSRKSKRKTKLIIDYNEVDDLEDENVTLGSRDTIYNIDSGVQMQDFNLLTAKDTSSMPLTEEIESSHFMEILEQDKSAQEELAQFRNSSYSYMYPVSVEELDINSSSEIDLFQSLNQIVPNQFSTHQRAISYDYKDDFNQIGDCYSDHMLQSLNMSIY